MTNPDPADPAASDARLSQIKTRHEREAADYAGLDNGPLLIHTPSLWQAAHLDRGWLLARLDALQTELESYDGDDTTVTIGDLKHWLAEYDGPEADQLADYLDAKIAANTAASGPGSDST